MKTDIKQQEIEELSSDKVFELDQLINEGVNAKIPFDFIYPNTNKRVGVMLRPCTANEYQQAITRSKKFKTNFLTEILQLSLYKMDGDKFPSDKIEQLPAGVVTMLANEVSRISGIDLVSNVEINQENLVEELMGF